MHYEQLIELVNARSWTQLHVKLWLKAMRYNNTEAGLALGVHPKTISKMANGRAGVPLQTMLACQMLLVRGLKAEAIKMKQQAEEQSPT